MALRSRKTEPTKLVVALTTGVLRVRDDKYHFTEGERLAADSPVVRAFPHLFVSSDLPDAEIAAARYQHRLKARGVIAA